MAASSRIGVSKNKITIGVNTSGIGKYRQIIYTNQIINHITITCTIAIFRRKERENRDQNNVRINTTISSIKRKIARINHS